MPHGNTSERTPEHVGRAFVGAWKALPPPHASRFTPDVDRRIISGYLKNTRAMVEELGRAGFSASAIARRGEALGVTKSALAPSEPGQQRPAARECLCCERTFLSFGIQNRLCRRCRAHR